MARYAVYPNNTQTLERIERLRRHHDHLKTLDGAYGLMRHEQTYDRMRDAGFRCDPAKMKELDSSHFTSLIVRLSAEEGHQFFAAVEKVYIQAHTSSLPSSYVIRSLVSFTSAIALILTISASIGKAGGPLGTRSKHEWF
jgi:hypothetical protein